MTSRQTGMLPKDFTRSDGNITDTSAVKPAPSGKLPKGLTRPHGRKMNAVLVKTAPPGSMPKGFGRPPDNPGHIGTDADPTRLKHEANDPGSILLNVQITEFVGTPADMTMMNANLLLPKVTCHDSDGHVYHDVYTIFNKHYETWFCVLECRSCHLCIKSSCSRFEIGVVRRLFRGILYKQTTRSRNHRIICIRYDRSEQRGNSK